VDALGLIGQLLGIMLRARRRRNRRSRSAA
jgi:hypothetical protein